MPNSWRLCLLFSLAIFDGWCVHHCVQSFKPPASMFRFAMYLIGSAGSTAWMTMEWGLRRPNERSVIIDISFVVGAIAAVASMPIYIHDSAMWKSAFIGIGIGTTVDMAVLTLLYSLACIRFFWQLWRHPESEEHQPVDGQQAIDEGTAGNMPQHGS